jgi:hypothetical protein
LAEHFGRTSKQYKVDRDATTGERDRRKKKKEESNRSPPSFAGSTFRLPAIGQEKKKKTQEPLPPTHTANTRTHNGPQLNGEWRTQKEKRKEKGRSAYKTRSLLLLFSLPSIHPQFSSLEDGGKEKTKQKRETQPH